MYLRVERKLAAGDIVIIDGGTGTEIQRRGAPMDSDVWCATANLTHPDVVRGVHEDYVRAGAEVIIANTFATSPLLFHALGRSADIREMDATALRLAREAVDEAAEIPIAVAGSFSTMRPVVKGDDRTDTSINWTAREAVPLMRAKAEALAEGGADLIVMEMMRDIDYSLWAAEAAVATGLPVWVGVSVERRPDRRLAGFARPEWSLEDVTSALMGTGAVACLVMHSRIEDTADALQVVKSCWAGPVGAYPEAGTFRMPDWQFVDVPPGDFVEQCRRWRVLGATVLGGCCGIGPEHIAAISAAFKGGTQ